MREADAEPPSLAPLHGAFAGARRDPDHVALFAGWTRLVTEPLGDCSGAPGQGFVHGDTLYVSRYRLTVGGEAPKRTMTATTAPNRWCGVFVDRSSGESGELGDGVVPRGALEVTVLRTIDGGWAETISLVNHSSHEATGRIRIELECPLVDIQYAEEMKCEEQLRYGPPFAPTIERAAPEALMRIGFRREFGRRRISAEEELRPILGSSAPRVGELVSRELRIEAPEGVRVAVHDGTTTLDFVRELRPRRESRIELRFSVVHDERFEIEAPRPTRGEALPTARTGGSPHDAEILTSSSTVNMMIAQARVDLESLELPLFAPGIDRPDARGIIAGVPRYIGVFGRDILTTAWQAAMLTTRFIEQAVERMALYVGVRYVPFRDEEPGRLPHERRIDPDSEVGERNREIYYGDVASTPFWIVTLASAYHWTGNSHLIHRMMPVLEATCRFIERRIVEGDGFVYYAPATPMGNRHHAWKDSGDALVDGEGRISLPPIAAAEIQGYARLALAAAAEMMLVVGRPERAAELFCQAEQLTARFRRSFLLPDKSFYAMGLGPRGELLDAIGSNVGHCVGCGILPRDELPRVVDRLMAEDMFSGWGVRTLASTNAAYDPFSYHRGSVWPVENATIAAGFRLHGFEDEAERIIGAQLAAATLFDRMRLPEAMSGLSRDGDRPIPGLYPHANLLQAWSVSAIPFLLQILLGIRPVGQLRTLLVKPRLPRWLPWVKIRGLHVGGAKLSLEFLRERDGSQRWRVLEKAGTVHVIEHSPSVALSSLREWFVRRVGGHRAMRPGGR